MRSADVLQRLLSKIVEDSNGCWVWQGARGGGKNMSLYGRMRVPKELGEEMGCPGGMVYVHRLSVWLHSGPFDSTLVVHHRCHNTLCCNPDHVVAVDENTNAIEANDVRWASVATTTEDDWADG